MAADIIEDIIIDSRHVRHPVAAKEQRVLSYCFCYSCKGHVELPLNEEEKAKFAASAAAVWKTNAALREVGAL